MTVLRGRWNWLAVVLLVAAMMVTVPVETAAAWTCSPRPPVKVKADPYGLIAFSTGAPIQSVLVTGTWNAEIVQAPLWSNEPGTGYGSGTIRAIRTDKSKGYTVAFRVVDECGPWNTFAGYGSGV